MLHILLLILKIVGIILAVILGITIVLVAIVSFVPIRYEISAKSDGDIESLKARVNATWLLHLFRADVFLKGKKVKWTARFAWIKKTNAVIKSVPNEKNKDNDENEEKNCNQESPKTKENTVENAECEKASEYIEEKPEKDRKMYQESDNTDERVTYSQDNKTSKKGSLRDKINGIIKKFKDLIEKKEKITGFITDQSHVNAFKKTKRFFFVFLKRLKPGEVKGKLRFGFDDPATTGKVLGGLSMFYPIFEDSFEIIPDFEKQILKGVVYLKGKIRLCHLVSLMVKLIMCKDVRITYRDFRNFKL